MGKFASLVQRALTLRLIWVLPLIPVGSVSQSRCCCLHLYLCICVSASLWTGAYHMWATFLKAFLLTVRQILNMCRSVARDWSGDTWEHHCSINRSRKVQWIKFTRLQEMKCTMLKVSSQTWWLMRSPSGPHFRPYSGFPAHALQELPPREENGVCCKHVERILIRW